MHLDSESRMLVKTAGALLALLALTIGMAMVNLGAFNLPVALVIGAVKAFIVVSIFMEIRSSSRLIWIIALLGLIWFLILFSGTLADYFTREVLLAPF